jgi:general secretion pathway protein K
VVAVLWFLMLIAVIGGSLLRQVRSDRALATNAVALVEAQLLADAGIRRAILSLIDPQDPVRWQLGGAPRSVSLFGHEITVRVDSESGKIDLGAAPSLLLSALFRSQGVAPGEADLLATRIIEWRTPATVAETDETSDPYRAAGRAYGPRHGPFRSVDELRLVLGMTERLQEAVAPLVTVYSRSPSVDRRVATDGVLRVLEEGGDGLATSQREARQRNEAAGADRLPVPGEAVRIEAHVEADGFSVLRSAVVRLTGARIQPYWIMAWR